MPKLKVLNPYDQSVVDEAPWATNAEIAAALEKAKNYFDSWKTSSTHDRSELLKQIHQMLRQSHEEYAKLICSEAGKPITLARAEVDRALTVLEWASAEAARFGGLWHPVDSQPSGRSGWGIVQRFPIGPVLGITPFNFPLNLMVHKVAPALAVGCSIVVKPSPETPLVAQKFCAAIEAIQPGLVQFVLANDQQTAALTQAKEIQKISFTGSTRVGWLIREQAPHKPATLELGGNAWAVITPSARNSIPTIAGKVLAGALGYAGQSCISVQNIAIHEDVHTEFVEELKRQFETFPIGDPSDEKTLCGPVINQAAFERLSQVFGSDKTSHSSREYSSENGWTVSPRLFFGDMLSSAKTHPSMSQELFGPVAYCFKYQRLEEAIGAINASPFGLQAGLFSNDLAEIKRFFQSVSTGGVVINDAPTLRLDHQPYGGVKQSGIGREGMRYAMDEMSQIRFLNLSDLPISN